ncbi:MAG TPA: hypothetical protein VMB82_09580, partial [Acidimicrobiales bacterium]|nr:hypothetical protein [Acidimicrobiales bacterium]
MTDRFERSAGGRDRWGEWPSPISPSVLAEARLSLSGLQVVGDEVWWSQSRPSDGGRQAVLRSAVPPSGPEAPGPIAEAGPEAVSVRSRVHEYGGGAWTVDPDTGALYLVDAVDQAVWLHRPGSPLQRLSGVAPEDESWRHGDLRVVPGGEWLMAVRERHHPGGVDDEIVAMPTGRDGPPVVVLSGRDFFAAPRPSPDGSRLAWLTWDHPDMPWDGGELWAGELVVAGGGPAVRAGRRIAGGPRESVGQPTWGRHGELWFVSDRRGWWQPYRWEPGSDPPVHPVVDESAEFHSPDWVLGQSTLVPQPDGSLVARVRRLGRDRLVLVDPTEGTATEIAQPCVAIA